MRATVKKKIKQRQTLLQTPVWSLSLSLSPTPFILRVPLDPAEAGPRHQSLPQAHIQPNFLSEGPFQISHREVESTRMLFLLHSEDLGSAALLWLANAGASWKGAFPQDPVVRLQEAAAQDHLNFLWLAAQSHQCPG